MLGKSQRQVMRYVKTKRLKASGGGRGVPYTFAPADIEAFITRHSGVANADLLARVAHGYATNFGDVGFWTAEHDLLWKWHKAGRLEMVEPFTREAYPATVPPAVKSWARKLLRKLNPSELDYVMALFIARKTAISTRKASHKNALGVIVKRLFNEAGASGKFRIPTALLPENVRLFFEAVIRGDSLSVNEYAGKDFPPDYDGRGSPSIWEALKTFRHTVRHFWRGSIRPARVAAVLGIHRWQAIRIEERIRKKLGKKGLTSLARKLKLDNREIPPSWKLKLAAKQSIQPQETLDAKADWQSIAEMLGCKVSELPCSKDALYELLKDRQHLQREADRMAGDKGEA